jgi:hypothetical protein
LPHARDLQGHWSLGGGGRRTGSLQIGWPAGHSQGRPFLLEPPLGPTTFWTVHRGGSIPVDRLRGHREV